CQAGKCMAQGVWRDVGQPRLFTDAIQHAHHADEMALAPIGREEVERFRLWLIEQQINGGTPDYPRLRTALGVREPNWTSPGKVESDLLKFDRRLAHDGSNKETAWSPCRAYG